MSAFVITDIVDSPSVDALMTRFDGEKNHALQELRNDWMYSITKLPPQEQPVIYHTLGFAGAGKTTLLEHCHAKGDVFPAHAFFLGFDRVMESCQAYQHDFDHFGAEDAFNRWEIPARALGYELLQEALKRRVHIIFEHSGARQDHVEMLRYIKETLGYKIILLDVQNDPEKVLERIGSRSRFLPREYIVERKKTIDQLKPLYHRLADEYHTFDLSVFPPQKIEDKGYGL